MTPPFVRSSPRRLGDVQAHAQPDAAAPLSVALAPILCAYCRACGDHWQRCTSDASGGWAGFQSRRARRRVLAQAVAELGAGAALAAYAERRDVDVARGVAFTDLLASGFMGDSLPLRATRGAVLAAVDMLPFARRSLAARMLFGARS